MVCRKIEEKDVKEGQWYKARVTGWHPRKVIRISDDRTKVQYDGPGVRWDKYYPPWVDMSKFLAWCGGEMSPEEVGNLDEGCLF